MEIKYSKEIMFIDNYKQIYSVKNDLIILHDFYLKGLDLKIKYIDKSRIIISGTINEVIRGKINEISYNDEQG